MQSAGTGPRDPCARLDTVSKQKVIFIVGMKETWLYFSGGLHTAVLAVAIHVREPGAAWWHGALTSPQSLTQAHCKSHVRKMVCLSNLL